MTLSYCWGLIKSIIFCIARADKVEANSLSPCPWFQTLKVTHFLHDLSWEGNKKSKCPIEIWKVISAVRLGSRRRRDVSGKRVHRRYPWMGGRNRGKAVRFVRVRLDI